MSNMPHTVHSFIYLIHPFYQNIDIGQFNKIQYIDVKQYFKITFLD